LAIFIELLQSEQGQYEGLPRVPCGACTCPRSNLKRAVQDIS
jgi:hypothetical protein